MFSEVLLVSQPSCSHKLQFERTNKHLNQKRSGWSRLSVSSSPFIVDSAAALQSRVCGGEREALDVEGSGVSGGQL